MASMLVRSTSFLNKHMVRKNHNISVDELSHALELTDKAELSEENNILEGIIRFGGETACPLPGTEIRYTTDGSMPTKESALYNGALEVVNKATV